MMWALWSTIVYRVVWLRLPMLDRWLRCFMNQAPLCSRGLVWWWPVACDARTRCCAPDVVRTSQQQNHILFLACRDYLTSIPSLDLSLPHTLFLSLSITLTLFLSLPLARSFTLFRPDLSQTRLPQITGSPDHQTGPDRTAPHRTVPRRTINSALSRYCKLLTAPCYSAYCLLSATPSSATPAPRHSFPPPVAP